MPDHLVDDDVPDRIEYAGLGGDVAAGCDGVGARLDIVSSVLWMDSRSLAASSGIALSRRLSSRWAVAGARPRVWPATSRCWRVTSAKVGAVATVNGRVDWGQWARSFANALVS